MSEIRKCKACDDEFVWNNDVIVVEDNLYHKDCVNLYPTGFVAYIDDEYLRETENDDGQMACEIISDFFNDDDE